jgi:heptosyltransferase I
MILLERYSAARIVIIKPSALGDIVHAMPALEAIRFRYPKAHIAWVVNQSFAALVTDHPALNETIPFDRGASKRGKFQGVRSFLDLCKRLRQGQFDLAIDLQGLLRSGMMTLATGAPRRVGYRNAREGARHSYTDQLTTPPLREQHAVERNWTIAHALGVGDSPKEFRIPVQLPAKLKMQGLLESLPRPWIAVALGAKWQTKQWPPLSFAELANHAIRQTGGTIILIGSPEDQLLSQSFLERYSGPMLNLIGKTNMAELVATLATCDLMIGNDTGPTHLAAALGKPAIVPFTCTRIHLHGPFGQFQNSVETGVYCKGSYIKTCDRLDCMKELTPDRLWQPLQEVLRSWQYNFHSH